MEDLHPVKQKIFEAIEDIILTQGLEAVTFTELSRRCFLQPSGIVYYFDSKTNMMREFFEDIMSRAMPVNIMKAAGISESDKSAGAFCKLIDYVLYARDYSDPLGNALLRSTLSASDADLPMRDLVTSVQQESLKSITQAILSFRGHGIFEESRFAESLSCFLYTALGYQYTGYIGYVPSEELQSLISPVFIAEHLKRSFLKDGTYPLPNE